MEKPLINLLRRAHEIKGLGTMKPHTANIDGLLQKLETRSRSDPYLREKINDIKSITYSEKEFRKNFPKALETQMDIFASQFELIRELHELLTSANILEKTLPQALKMARSVNNANVEPIEKGNEALQTFNRELYHRAARILHHFTKSIYHSLELAKKKR